MPALSPRQQFLNDVARERGEPRCDKCCEPTSNLPDDNDEILCDDCLQNAAENAWERHCEDFHDGGSTRFRPLLDQQIEAMKVK